MKKTILLKGIEIGEGTPKLIVPIVGSTAESIYENAKTLCDIELDVIEWRVDFFEDAKDVDTVLKVLEKLKEIVSPKLLLFTFRTTNEGGKQNIEMATYTNLNKSVAETGLVDFIDVEIFLGDEVVKENIQNIQNAGVLVVASNHDFIKTPSKDELIQRMIKMQKMGADIPKIAMMPQNQEQVLELLKATYEMSSKFANGPIITMSMGPLGVISRICGEVFGSSMTFGTVGQKSAPGQIPLDELKVCLEIIHKAL